MGAVSVSNTCIDGTQQATITATNGTTTIVIDGIETHELTVGAGEHVIVWYGPASHDPTVTVEWNRTVIDVPVLDCTPDTSTTSEPTTSEATVTTAPTTTLPMSSVPSTQPATTWALDTPQTAVTVAEIGHARGLPATGSEGIVLPIAAGLIVVGSIGAWCVRRRPA